MATWAGKVGGTFPAGTVAGAYKQSLWDPAVPPSGAPLGSPDTTAVVGADLSLAFSGLTDNTPYFVAAQVGGNWVYERFRTPAVSYFTGQPPIRVLLAGHSRDGHRVHAPGRLQAA